MVQRTFRAAMLASLVASALAAPVAGQAKPVFISYYLHKTGVSATVSQTLMRCPPVGEGEIEVVTSWALKASTGPDYKRVVSLDVSSGSLADRTVAMTLNPDGTLAAINTKSQSKAGDIVTSAIKLVGTVAPMLAPVGPILKSKAASAEKSGEFSKPLPILKQRCNAQTLAALQERSVWAAEVADLENAIAMGQATQAQIEMLASRRAQLAQADASLTLTAQADGLSEQVAALTPQAIADPTKMAGSVNVTMASYAAWLANAAERPKEIPGALNGFKVSWAASVPAAASLTAMKTLEQSAGKSRSNSGTIRQMTYLRPVPAVLIAQPSACADKAGASACGPRDDAASAQIAFGIPQLSPEFFIPVGTGGLFGSREVKAAFDATGRPVELSYGSTSGATAFAGAVDAGAAAATSLYNAELNALKHAVELAEARAKLAAFATTQ